MIHFALVENVMDDDQRSSTGKLPPLTLCSVFQFNIILQDYQSDICVSFDIFNGEDIFFSVDEFYFGGFLLVGNNNDR